MFAPGRGRREAARNCRESSAGKAEPGSMRFQGSRCKFQKATPGGYEMRSPTHQPGANDRSADQGMFDIRFPVLLFIDARLIFAYKPTERKIVVKIAQGTFTQRTK